MLVWLLFRRRWASKNRARVGDIEGYHYYWRYIIEYHCVAFGEVDVALQSRKVLGER